MSIRLHKEKFLNPHLTFCPRCGGDGPDLLLLGAVDKVYRCLKCGMLHIGYPKGKICQKCSGDVEFERKLDDHERLPGNWCDACEKEAKEHEEIVDAGGIYFKCADCKVEGVLKPSEYTELVRKQIGVEAPKPCGIEYTKGDCPVCSTGE